MLADRAHHNDAHARILGDRLYENIAAWALEAGKSGSTAELIEFFLRDGSAALHEGGDNLAPTLVGKPDHCDLRYCRMQRQATLDLYRRDVFPPGDDHIV